MSRRLRRNATGIRGSGAVNYQDIYRVFECSRPGCQQLLKVLEQDLDDGGDAFAAGCPACGAPTPAGLIRRAPRWKYCRVCEWLQPLDHFHRHRSMRSGHQMECRVCKNTLINPQLNPLRTSDQHREAADRRRLYGLFADDRKVDSAAVFRRFDHRCFQCGRVLAPGEAHLDHTLPVRYLWPLSTGPTLLCADCNGSKAERWPSEFYPPGPKLQALSRLTGIPHDTLAGPPFLNPEGVARILADVDGFLEKWIRYPDDVRRLRDLILGRDGVDIYERAATVPDFLRGQERWQERLLL